MSICIPPIEDILQVPDIFKPVLKVVFDGVKDKPLTLDQMYSLGYLSADTFMKVVAQTPSIIQENISSVLPSIVFASILPTFTTIAFIVLALWYSKVFSGIASLVLIAIMLVLFLVCTAWLVYSTNTLAQNVIMETQSVVQENVENVRQDFFRKGIDILKNPSVEKCQK